MQWINHKNFCKFIDELAIFLSVTLSFRVFSTITKLHLIHWIKLSHVYWNEIIHKIDAPFSLAQAIVYFVLTKCNLLFNITIALATKTFHLKNYMEIAEFVGYTNLSIFRCGVKINREGKNVQSVFELFYLTQFELERSVKIVFTVYFEQNPNLAAITNECKLKL